jgi:hypothetical protein
VIKKYFTPEFFQIESILEKKKDFVIIFIIALLLGVGVTHPQITLNDEWISMNQLAQLDQGHQFVVNEGKFGSYANGTPYPYFQSRNNALGYPIFLPLISLPALKLIKIVGDAFDYWIITMWTLLLIVLGLLVEKLYSKVVIFRNFSFSSLLIILGFFLFLLNLIFYSPFTISTADAPREAAAIILTDNFIFAGLAVIIFSINITLFKNRLFTLFATFICITSSSYLIWASSGKDHMLEIFLFSLIVFGLVHFFHSKKIHYCFFSFLCIGILAWDRPEIGLFLLTFLLIGMFPFFVKQLVATKEIRNIGYFLFLPFCAALGALPLFLNNYIVSNNPLIPVYSVWSIGINSSSAINPYISTNSSLNMIGSLASLLNMSLNWITPTSGASNYDLIRILFLPESGSVGLLILVPIFLIGLVSLPSVLKKRPLCFNYNESFLILLLFLMSIGIIITYIKSFPILNSDAGIFPDVRYLSPIYLLLNLIGLIIISKCSLLCHRIQSLFAYTATFFFLLLPFSLLLYFLSAHQNNQYANLSSSVSLGMLIAIICILTIYSALIYGIQCNNLLKKVLPALLGLSLILPLIWQILTIFIMSIIGSGIATGYTYWLPSVRQTSESLYYFLVAHFL